MANENTIAKAYVQIMPSMSGIKDALSGEMQASGGSASKSFASSFVSTLKTALVTAGIGKALSSALNEGSELQQNLGGTQAVFQEYADDLQSIAQDAYKNMGMSASEYMATANKMTSLFKGSGMDIATSMDLTTSAMQRAADVASVMGIDTAWAMESIAGAAKGNFTMMDNLGVAMNATTLQAYALEKGMNFNWNTATQAEKATLAMEMFMERTQDMAGNFARESEETLSGSFGAMKSAFSDVLGNLTLGNDIKPSLKALVSTTSTYLFKNLIPAVGNIVTGIPTAIGELIVTQGPQFMETAKAMIDSMVAGFPEAIPTLLAQALPMLMQFTENLKVNAGLLVDSGIDIIMSIVQGIVNSLPLLITYVPTIISNIANIINENVPKLLMCAMNIIMALGQGLIDNIPLLIENFGLIIQAIWDTFTAINWWQLASNILTMLGNGLISFGGIIKDNLVNIAKKGFDAVKNIDWVSLGKNIIQGVVNGIKKFAGLVLDALLNVAKTAFNAVCEFLGIASPSKEFKWVGQMVDEGLAKGIAGNVGTVKKAMQTVTNSITGVGQVQAMDYLINSNTSLNRLGSNGTTQGINSSGYNQTVIINAPSELSPSEVARQTRNATRDMVLSLNLGGSL